MAILTFEEATHEYKIDGVFVPSVTKILSGTGLVNYDKVNEKVLEYKRTLGKIGHRIMEWEDNGTLDEESVDPKLMPYLIAWRKCKKDTGMKIESIEEPVFSSSLKVAGRLDRRVFLDKRGILDLKFTSSVLPATRIQLAGYETLYNEGKKVQDRSFGRWCVQLKEDETYKIIEYKDKNDKNIFLAALTIYNFMNGANK